MKQYDTFVLGPISKDININCEGKVVKRNGGAVVDCSYSAYAGGNAVGLLTNIAKEDEALLEVFNIPKENVHAVFGTGTTSIKNQYLTPDKERRECTAIGRADTITSKDIPMDITSHIFHLAGLIVGDFDDDLIEYLAGKGKVAVDVQGFLRSEIDGAMIFKDWVNKEKRLPYITYLKTDAAEAKILTGLDDREAAAKQLYGWGAKEIMITHHTEVLIYDGENFYKSPFKARNLSGRTGRGDTCFSAYVTERLRKTPAEALQYAAALTSLKMEFPGPFKGTREDVMDYIKKFY